MASSSSAVTAAHPGDDRLLALLLSELSGDEQQMFVRSFHLYLQHNPRHDLVVDLDAVWEEVGFSTKQNAKTALMNYWEKAEQAGHPAAGKPYSISVAPKQDAKHGGTNKERILMTVNAFKQLCLSAQTHQGTRYREYYINMEAVMLEYVRQVADERVRECERALQAQKQETMQEAVLAARKQRHELLVKAYAARPLVYLGLVTVLPDGRLLIKLGYSLDIPGRVKGLILAWGSFYLLDVFPCSNPLQLEQWLLNQPLFMNRAYVLPVNGRCGTELIEHGRAQRVDQRAAVGQAAVRHRGQLLRTGRAGPGQRALRGRTRQPVHCVRKHDEPIGAAPFPGRRRCWRPPRRRPDRTCAPPRQPRAGE
jgi:phage anti-repressor protein